MTKRLLLAIALIAAIEAAFFAKPYIAYDMQLLQVQADGDSNQDHYHLEKGK